MFSLSKRTKTIDTGTVRFVFFMSLAAFFFILLGHYYPGKIQAVLKKPLLTVPSAVIDWWSVTHMIFFGILAFFFPDHLFELFLFGVFWEVVEDGLSPRDSKGIVNCDTNYKNELINTFKDMWCDNIAREKDYWYGKWDDVFSNLIGLLVGHFIRTNNLHFF
jgi:hypothetical protein